MRRSFALIGFRRRVLFGALAAAPALLIGSALLSTHSAQADPDDTFSVHRSYKVGDIDRYDINLHTVVSNPMIGDNVDVTMKLLMKETTKSVTTEGNATLFVEFESAFVKLGDNENDISSFLPTSTQTVSKTGGVISAKADGEAPGPAAMIGRLIQSIADGEQAFYPSKAVKVGETWNIDTKSDKPEGPNSTMKGTATLTGTEMINGMKTMVVKSVTDTVIKNIPKPKGGDDAGIPIPKEVTVHFEATGNVDVATGRIVKTVGTLTSNGSAAFKNKLELKVALAAPKDAAPAAK